MKFSKPIYTSTDQLCGYIPVNQHCDLFYHLIVTFIPSITKSSMPKASSLAPHPQLSLHGSKRRTRQAADKAALG